MRRARLIVVVLGFASLFATASGQPVSQLRPSNYVNDFAHVLSPETEASLNDLCNQVEEKAGAQIAVVTINSLDGRDIEGYEFSPAVIRQGVPRPLDGDAAAAATSAWNQLRGCTGLAP